MASTTDISWADSSWNGWVSCSQISVGPMGACTNCYAEARMDHRLKFVKWGPGQPRRRTSEKNWKEPAKWTAHNWVECNSCGWRGSVVDAHDGKRCAKCESTRLKPTRLRIFTSSLSDILDNEVPVQWLADVLKVIVHTPRADWLVLTKRIGNWRTRLQAALEVSDDQATRNMIARWLQGHAPHNIWLGITVVTQVEVDRDVHKLLSIPAVIRFLSMEPLMDAVDLTSVHWPGKGGHRVDVLRAGYWNKEGHLAGGPSAELGAPRGGFTNHSDMERINWVISGGESGRNARPTNPKWVRSLRDQTLEAGTSFHYKQHGEWIEWTPELGVEATFSFMDGTQMVRLNKKGNGCKLDGEYHLAFPDSPGLRIAA